MVNVKNKVLFNSIFLENNIFREGKKRYLPIEGGGICVFLQFSA